MSTPSHGHDVEAGLKYALRGSWRRRPGSDPGEPSPAARSADAADHPAAQAQKIDSASLARALDRLSQVVQNGNRSPHDAWEQLRQDLRPAGDHT